MKIRTIIAVLICFFYQNSIAQVHPTNVANTAPTFDTIIKADWLVGKWQSIKPLGYTLEFIDKKPILVTSHIIDPWGGFTFFVDSTGTVNPKAWGGGWPPIYFEVKRIGEYEIETQCYQFGYSPSEELKVLYKKIKE